MATPVLSIPGLGSSGPEHWQTLWEKANPNFKRVEQRDWEHPLRDEWVKTLEVAVKSCSAPPILIAHSLGCLTIAYWAEQTTLKAKGALLVAPPDSERVNFPSDKAVGFSPVPSKALPFASIVVASTNDQFCSISRAETFAKNWGSEFIDLGNAGHINADSNLGEWDEGFLLLQHLY